MIDEIQMIKQNFCSPGLKKIQNFDRGLKK